MNLKIKYPEVTYIFVFWKPKSLFLLYFVSPSCRFTTSSPWSWLYKKGTFLLQAKFIIKAPPRAQSCTQSSLFSLTGTFTESFFFPYSVLDSELLLKRQNIIPHISTAWHSFQSIIYLHHKANRGHLWTVHLRLSALRFFELHTPSFSKHLQPRLQSNSSPYSLLLGCTLRGSTFKIISEYALSIVLCIQAYGIKRDGFSLVKPKAASLEVRFCYSIRYLPGCYHQLLCFWPCWSLLNLRYRRLNLKAA